ncbi:MAG TPA: nucleoside-diphosphate kinase [Candidatus Dormibacteraeota bacterium]|nr:nucleoside-diphosphate kinase [Candidatus Dormibacteraeota bacterium]
MPDALVIFKPDAAHRLAVRAGIWSWLSTEREWKIASLAWYQPPANLIESHYDFLQGRPFFPWLVDFMTALPLVVGRVTASTEALERMRYDLGETRIAQSRPGSLRERFGIFGGINCVHLSDAPETGAAEVKRWSQFLPLDKIDVNLDQASRKPDHTFHLRSLATQVAAGIHVEPATRTIRELIAEETDLTGERLEALYRITLGALA